MTIRGWCWYCHQEDAHCILVKREGELLVACRKCAHPADVRFWQAYFAERIAEIP